MRGFIGMDIGTSAVKGVLLDETGRLIATSTEPFEYIIEGEARFLDPEAFCDRCVSVIKNLSRADSETEIAAICSCCASGNPLFLDGEGKPITPIIGWQTRVSQEDIDKVYTKEEQEGFYRMVGWPLGHGMPAANLAWITLHKPEILEKMSFMTMSAEYLNHRLTGKWGIAHSMGTPSFLMDQEKGIYNRKMLDKFGISESSLPPIFEKGTVLGELTESSAAELGLSRDVKVVLGSFDHPSGALGAGVFDEGDMLLSCGTSWVELFPVGSREFGLETKGLVDRFMLNGAPYCVMKSLTSVTEKINMRRWHFFGEISHAEFDGYVAEASLGCGGLKVDFTENDFPAAEGHSKPEIARAVIEGAALMLKDNLYELGRCGLKAERITAIGGITNSAICTNVISEILEQEIKVVNGQSAGAVGSALLAGMGLGIFRDERDAFSRMSGWLK